MNEYNLIKLIYENMDDGKGILNFYIENFELIIITDDNKKFVVDVKEI